MDPDAVAEVIAAFRRLWEAGPDLEVSLEANPTDAEAGRFAGLAEAGVNRLSLGLQSLEDEALVQLGRNHDAAAGRRATQTALKVFSRVSIDLIYARPDQTPQAWAAELEAALAVLSQLRQQGPVFVHCVAAMERSPLVCLAWLVSRHGQTPERALDYLMQVHPGTSPLAGQLALLGRLHNP